METSSKKNFDIEALRAYAIVMTFAAHLNSLVPEWMSWLGYFWLGIGVQLFFAISGFLMTRSLLHSLQKTPFWIFAKSFWVRRIFRLWPAAFAVATSVVIISAVFPVAGTFESRALVAKSWLFAVLNLENFYIYNCLTYDPLCKQTPLWHYWSLSLEEQFYFVLPFCLFFVKNRKWLIGLFLIPALLQAATIRPIGSFLWFIRSEPLLYGSIIALLWQYYAPVLNALFNTLSRRKGQCVLALLSMFLIGLSRKEITAYFMGVVDVVAALMVLMASVDRDFLKVKFLPSALALYIGSRSYSIYLVHMPVFAIVRGLIQHFGLLNLALQPSRILASIISLAVTLILSEFSYRMVESPWRRFGRGLSVRVRSPHTITRP